MGVNHVSRNGAKQAPSGGKSLTDEAKGEVLHGQIKGVAIC